MKVILPSNKKLTKNLKTISFTNPKNVYIPLVVYNDRDVTPLVKKGDYVTKNMVIGKTKGNFRMPIFASVSGEVLGFEEKLYADGTHIKCVVIENDFKDALSEEDIVLKKLNEYSKEEFIDRLKESGIVGMGGSGFPSYIKYNCNDKIKTIIVNAVECEPYITADYTLLMEEAESILETVDALIEINQAENAIIAIKKGEEKLKEVINSFIGTYLNIKLVEVPNFYPMGWEKNLVKFITKKKYKKLPLEIGVVVSNVSTIYSMYEALKYGKPCVERLITFTGEGLNTPGNVYVRNGTLVKEVIEFIGGYTESDKNLIAGGPMMGHTVDEDLIISMDLNCVLVKDNEKNPKINPCLRCGKCEDVCPAKLSPVMIKDNVKNITFVRTLQPEKCIECGLCSFICPAKIPVREFVKEAKHSVCEVKK